VSDLTRYLLTFLLGFCALLVVSTSNAALTIEITQGAEGALPIAVVPFGWQGEGVAPEDISEIIANDLTRSGRFAALDKTQLVARPHFGNEVKFNTWRFLKVENLVIGNVRRTGAQQFEVRFQLFDIYKGVQLAGYTIPAPTTSLRRTAHQISDIIYETLTGEKGAFTTRIAYVTVEGALKHRTYFLNVSDADGFNEQTILRSREPLLSPSWAPDGRQLAYVSFEAGNSRIYQQDVFRGTRKLIASFKGLNSAPAWSPDGRWLAMTLSKDGNAEIYLLNMATRDLKRITFNRAIDTEAAWAPDGKSLLFTSDRGGNPQIYRVYVSSTGQRGELKRLTFEGKYNARASFAPNGKMIVFVHAVHGAYRIATLDLASGAINVLTETSLDESPSFAPNGSMIIYATNEQNRGVLAAVSVDGRVHQRLLIKNKDVREPAWSPFEQKKK
jgi:TolB protein